MSLVTPPSRAFDPGTTGWTVDDLDDPHVEALWAQGRYEIVEGVLTRMAPAYFSGGRSLLDLIILIKQHLGREQIAAEFATEVDIVIGKSRVARADALMLSEQDKVRQLKAVQALGTRDPNRTRILVPPTLVIESISPGHELHDEQTKKRWYAEFGVPNYWLLNALDRSLHCYRLEGDTYLLDAAGTNADEVRPAAFHKLRLPLMNLWMDW